MGTRGRCSRRWGRVFTAVMGNIGFIHALYGLFALGLTEVLARRLYIEVIRVALHDRQRAGRAGADAVTKPVTELLLD